MGRVAPNGGSRRRRGRRLLVALGACGLTACSPRGAATPDAGKAARADGPEAGTDAPPSPDGDGGADALDAGVADGVILPTNGVCPGDTLLDQDSGICACNLGETGCPTTSRYLCVDMQADPDNCGACGLSCAAASACRAGVCTPAPTEIGPPIAGCSGLRLALADGALYWTDAAHGTVNRRLASGGPIVTLASGEATPTAIAVSGGYVYWLAESTATIRRVSTAGGGPSVVVQSPNVNDPPMLMPGINGFTVAGDGTVYFSSETHVYRVAATGGSPVDVVDEVPFLFPAALALDGDVLVFAGMFGPIGVANLGAGVPVTCLGFNADAGTDTRSACTLSILDGDPLDTIVAQNGRAYWVENVRQEIESVPTDAVLGANHDDIAVVSDRDEIQAFTVNGDFVVEALANGEIASGSLEPGGAGQTFARVPNADSGVTSTTSVVADGSWVFWSTLDRAPQSTCAIEGVAR
jgi:hypothetical protein